MYHTSDGVHVVVAPTYAIVCAVASHNSQRPRNFPSSLRFGNVRNVRISLYGWHILCSAHSRSSCSCVTFGSLAGVSIHAASCRSRCKIGSSQSSQMSIEYLLCTVRTVCVVCKDRVLTPRTVCVEVHVARIVIAYDMTSTIILGMSISPRSS